MCLFCDKKPEVPMQRNPYDLGRDARTIAKSSELELCPLARFKLLTIEGLKYTALSFGVNRDVHYESKFYAFQGS
jgi:hypothetical protein